MARDVTEVRIRATAGPTRPCVFVSHRQADVNPAARIAYLACQTGFDYWLDALDPTLPGAGLVSTEQAAAATAAIIEMALLNSSHVIAVITPNTKGSQWVPYEYGRVKLSETVSSLQAACWIYKATTGTPLPEYLYLGPIFKTESEIQQWLRTELQKHPGRNSPGACSWMTPTPASL